MARNGSGTYSLPVAPFTPGTTISSSDVNSDFSDIATALTGSIAADGQTAITGQLKGALGTAPTYSISGDLNTGFGSSTADTAFIQCGGTNIISCTTAGATITGNLSVTSVTSAVTFSGGAGTPVTLYWNDASAAIGPNLIITRDSASPAASDSIGAIFFNGNNTTPAAKSYSAIKTQITAATPASEAANLFLQTQVAGTLTTILQSSGADIAIPGNLVVTGSVTQGTTKPTVQRFTSGSGNYTTPANVRYIKVTMCGPGGGGAAATTNNGTNGTANSSFGSWTAVLGQGGVTSNGAGGIGGTGGTDVADASNKLIDRVSGGVGAGGGTSGTAGVVPFAGSGGSNPRGGAGAGGKSATAGTNAAANSGGGGGGGGANAGTQGGGGGGAGEWVQFYVYPTAAQVIAYVVGAAGAGGIAGVNAGGNGAAGVLIVEEFYS